MSSYQNGGLALSTLNNYFEKHKKQLAAALPKHMNADRMVRLALTAFSQNKDLAECDPRSIFSSIIIASQLGLEIGISGQGYLVPYKGVCTFVPGWQGYVDLIGRAGRASVWTNAVFKGDEFHYQLGTNPIVEHRPGIESDPALITHTYAIGRVNGSEWPIIEVWPVEKIIRHRDKYNKVGGKHYSYKSLEMYARKVPLMQVLKYLPKSVELLTAMQIDVAASEGRGAEFINGNYELMPSDSHQVEHTQAAEPEEAQETPQAWTETSFARQFKKWSSAISEGRCTHDECIDTMLQKAALTDEQLNAIKSIQAPKSAATAH